MKINTAERKAKRLIQQLQKLDKQTPKIKKSLSTFTSTNYLQLQLTTSTKKKQQMQKHLEQKQFKIKQLSQQIIQNQLLVRSTIQKYKQCLYEQQQKQLLFQQKDQKIKINENQKILLSKKYDKLEIENNKLQRQNELLKETLKVQKQKHAIQKDKRKKQKKEFKQILLQMMHQISILKQQIDKIHQKQIN